ncbi:hypothetical protein TNCV_94701 [Trichonephila clavipes]|nr:hypothetical protein TNCV_94701 [Trichonephila clavipes]
MRRNVEIRRAEAVGSLVVRASDSRPEGLGSMPMPSNTLRVHTEYVLVKSVGGIVVSPSIVLFGEFCRANSYCHLYGAQGQRQAYF